MKNQINLTVGIFNALVAVGLLVIIINVPTSPTWLAVDVLLLAGNIAFATINLCAAFLD